MSINIRSVCHQETRHVPNPRRNDRGNPCEAAGRRPQGVPRLGLCRGVHGRADRRGRPDPRRPLPSLRRQAGTAGCGGRRTRPGNGPEAAAHLGRGARRLDGAPRTLPRLAAHGDRTRNPAHRATGRARRAGAGLGAGPAALHHVAGHPAAKPDGRRPGPRRRTSGAGAAHQRGADGRRLLDRRGARRWRTAGTELRALDLLLDGLRQR